MQRKSFINYYHLLFQARSLPASPSPEPASLSMAAGFQQGGGDGVTSLASLPASSPAGVRVCPGLCHGPSGRALG